MPMVELLFSLFMVYFVVGRSVGRSVGLSSFLQSIAQASSRPVTTRMAFSPRQFIVSDSPCLCDSKITMVVSTSHV